jgi:hypothetical protein
MELAQGKQIYLFVPVLEDGVGVLYYYEFLIDSRIRDPTKQYFASGGLV